MSGSELNENRGVGLTSPPTHLATQYVVWIGSAEATPPPEAAGELVMAWPREDGETVPFPGILYRQVQAVELDLGGLF